MGLRQVPYAMQACSCMIASARKRRGTRTSKTLTHVDADLIAKPASFIPRLLATVSTGSHQGPGPFCKRSSVPLGRCYPEKLCYLERT